MSLFEEPAKRIGRIKTATRDALSKQNRTFTIREIRDAIPAPWHLFGSAKRALKNRVLEDLLDEEIISLLIATSCLIDSCSDQGTPQDWKRLTDDTLCSHDTFFQCIDEAKEVFLSIAEDRMPAMPLNPPDDDALSLRMFTDEARAIMEGRLSAFTVSDDVSGALADTANLFRATARTNFGMPSPKVTWEARALASSIPSATQTAPQSRQRI